MLGWTMIHQIKSLYNEGKGASVRQIARQLAISRNSVRKYLHLSVEQIGQVQTRRKTHKLDPWRPLLRHYLVQYEKLSAVKLRQLIEEKGGQLPVANRALRTYVHDLKVELNQSRPRSYQPVIDLLPGVQCQVDLGEMNNVLIASQPSTVYFIVFVLSCSRLMYVTATDRPINTQTFIRMHDEAFRYFGGVVEECVYDQTKLVVLQEQFRELWLNQEFYQFATAANFQVRVCEGYDPESKGKVEAGVKYVKQNALYGSEFSAWSHLNNYLQTWLETVANPRLHGTTQRVPREHFEESERAALRPYLTPAYLSLSTSHGLPRKVDKTGLISFKGNLYSVPATFQRQQVNVLLQEDQVMIFDPQSQQQVAVHPFCRDKGKISKDPTHYADPQVIIAQREELIYALAGPDLGAPICTALQLSSPHIYTHQLKGLLQVLTRFAKHHDLRPALARLATYPRLSTSFIRDFLEASSGSTTPHSSVSSTAPSLQTQLTVYAPLCNALPGGHS